MDNTQCSSFPREIIENILKFADGATLLNAELVCSEWKRIVEYLDEKYDIWQKCDVDISKTEYFAIKQKLRDTEVQNKRKVILHNWKLWQNLKQRKPSFKTIATDTNCNTCVKISGDIIISGNMLGCVNFLSIRTDINFYYMCNTSYINDLYCLNAIPYDGTGFQHTHLLVFCKNALVFLKLDKDIAEVASKPEIMLYSVHRDILCFADKCSQVFVEKMYFTANGTIRFQTLTYSKMYEPINVRSLCIDSRIVTLITDWTVLKLDYNRAPVTFATIAHPLAHLTAEQYWILNNEVVFATLNGKLYYTPINTETREKSRAINCLAVLGSVVCDIYLHGCVLIITTDSGMVYMYYVKNWQDFDPANCDIKIQIRAQPICGIDVQELENEQRLILCTSSSIIPVSFSK